MRLTISNVLTADYIGALVAALLFPLVLLPQLGLMGASLLFGALNLVVAGLALWLFREACSRRVWRGLAGALALAATVTGIAAWHSETTLGALERRLYTGEILLARDTRYQRIVVTRHGAELRLFLDGSIQFDTRDEHRYHEALVHPAMTRAPRIARVLILGGGDGMATREVLRYAEVGSVTLVDIDPAVTALFRDHATLSSLNGGALSDPRVEIVNADAWAYLRDPGPSFDVAILDLPDPKDLAVSKLYTRAFYADLMNRMGADGIVVTQATSPLYAREAFWTIRETLAATGAPLHPGETLRTRPYHAYVPSFGDWGFVLAAARMPRAQQRPYPPGLRFLDAATDARLAVFAPDIGPVEAAPNTLATQSLPRLYEAGWDAWFE